MKISCEDLTFFSGVSWDMMGYKEIHDQQKKACDMGVFENGLYPSSGVNSLGK